MKTKLLLLIIIFTISTSLTNAQCNTSAFGFGNNSNNQTYNVTGDIDVVLNTDNTITLNLGSNFATAAGPDIRAYLVKSNGDTNTQIRNAIHNQTINNLVHIEFGLVGAIGSIFQNGIKSFTVPIPVNSTIEDFDKVLFYCLEFNQFWDIGSFTPFSNSNCSVLSAEENMLSQNINFYPNPTSKDIILTNNKQIKSSIDIYDILGKKILQIDNNIAKQQIINLSSLKSGVYLVQIKAEGNNITKRLVKQ